MERKIEITINPGRRLPYEVSVNGERIDNLRSFEIKVSNEPREGQQEGPYYRAEQYWPITQGRNGAEEVTMQPLVLPGEMPE